MATRRLLVEIVGDDSSLHRALKSSSSGASGFGSVIGGVAKTAALAAGAAGIGALALTLKAGYSEWKQSETVSAQTEAVIKSTGGTAHVTAKQIDEMSTALLKKSGVDDEAIKSGANMLLTFTNVRNEAGKGNDIFNRSTKTLLDMTTAMSGGNVTQENMRKQAIQLGKALNDPIKGLSALRRVGVTFTQGQQDTIKKLVESGHTLKAQKIILHELNKEFGGSAEALGKTLPGQINIAQESFKNLAGEIFTKLVPVLNAVLNWVNAHWPQIEAVMGAVFTGIRVAILNGFVPAIHYMIVGVKAAVAWIRENWPKIKPYVLTVIGDIVTYVRAYVAVFRAIWRRFGTNIITEAKIAWEYVKATVKNALEVVRGIIDVVTGLIHGDWSRVWKGITEIVGGAVRQVWNILKTAVKTLGNEASAVGGVISDGFAAAFRWVERQAIALVNRLLDILRTAADAYNKVFGWATGNITVPHIGGGSGPTVGPTGPTGPSGAPHAAIRAAAAAAAATSSTSGVSPFSSRRGAGRGAGALVGELHVHTEGMYVGTRRQLQGEVVSALSQFARNNGLNDLRAILGAAGTG